MMILKLASLVSLSAAAAALAFALFRAAPRCAPWLLARRGRILDAADLAGIRIGQLICSLLAPASFALLPIFAIARRRRRAAADRQLPDALALLGNAMRAGLALPQALEMASLELAPPLGEELGRVVGGLRLGRTVEEALSLLANRLPTEDVCLVVQSVEALRRTGGNVIEIFATLALTIEGRLSVAERVRVLTAKGIYQGAMLLAMPWALGLLLWALAPDYLEPLFGTRIGALLIAIGIAMEAIGGLWLKRIVMIKV